MASLHFITGSTGAGKTSYSQHLAETFSAFRFSIEEWLIALYLMDAEGDPSTEWINERVLRCETLAKRLAEQALANRQIVIIDFGFSEQAQRERFYKWARSNGVAFKLHFLDVPKKPRWERVSRRNDEPGETFLKISKKAFDWKEKNFERPSDDELIENNGIRLVPEK